MVVITKLEELLPCELCAIVRDYRVWDPKAVDDVCEEFHGLLRPDLRDWLGLYPLHELIYGDKQVRIAPRRPFEGLNQIEPLDHKRSCDRDHLEP
jgi:hypothetical protein